MSWKETNFQNESTVLNDCHGGGNRQRPRDLCDDAMATGRRRKWRENWRWSGKRLTSTQNLLDPFSLLSTGKQYFKNTVIDKKLIVRKMKRFGMPFSSVLFSCWKWFQNVFNDVTQYILTRKKNASKIWEIKYVKFRKNGITNWSKCGNPEVDAGRQAKDGRLGRIGPCILDDILSHVAMGMRRSSLLN